MPVFVKCAGTEKFSHGLPVSDSPYVGGSQKGGFQRVGLADVPCTEISSKSPSLQCYTPQKTGRRVQSPKEPFYKAALLLPLDVS